jgi:hypothetical protein
MMKFSHLYILNGFKCSIAGRVWKSQLKEVAEWRQGQPTWRCVKPDSRLKFSIVTVGDMGDAKSLSISLEHRASP